MLFIYSYALHLCFKTKYSINIFNSCLPVLLCVSFPLCYHLYVLSSLLGSHSPLSSCLLNYAYFISLELKICFAALAKYIYVERSTDANDMIYGPPHSPISSYPKVCAVRVR